MSGKFRLLRRPINQQYENAVKSVKAIVVLHNFLRQQSLQHGEKISEKDDYDSEMMPTLSTNPQFNASGTVQAKAMRDELARYFMEEGKVAFQWDRTFGIR